MTGKEIYQDALALLGQKYGDNEAWDELALPWLNMVLAESHSTENTLRRYLDMEETAQAQRLESLEEEICCQPRLRQALVNGMAALLWDESHDRYKAQDYRARFVSALMEGEMVHPEKVVDVYA